MRCSRRAASPSTAQVRLEPGAQADPEHRPHHRSTGARCPRRAPLQHVAAAQAARLRDHPAAIPTGRPVVHRPAAARRARCVYPVGRLDFDAEGLLLLTNDGELANRLLHPRYEIPRVYEVEVEGRVAAADLPRWRRGVALDDGPAVPRARDAARRARDGSSRLRVTFAEGRYREVKRYCKALGHPVRRLRACSSGPFALGEPAPPGAAPRR